MSAWVVSKAHIDAIVRLAVLHAVDLYADGHRLDPRIEPDNLGQALVNECVASVKYRYPDDTDATLPGPNESYWLEPYRYNPLGRVPTPVEGLKIMLCYEYQTCEDIAWERRPVYQFCRSMEHALIDKLPGYDKAPWRWEAA